MALSKSIFGDRIDRMYEHLPESQIHIQRFLSANCFGDHQTRTAGALTSDHRGPFDRMLVAHRLNHSLTLVTADPALSARGDIAVVWAG